MIRGRDQRARSWLAPGIWIVACLALAACAAGDTTMSLGDFDQTCSAASDCAPVRSGDLCGGGCDCPNSAINKSDLSRYTMEEAQKVKSCSGKPVACPCVAPQVACDQGKCALE